MTTWNGEAQMQALKKAAAEGILRAAVYFETQHSQRIAKPNPPPYLDSSKPGEYMKLRTGAGRSGLTHEPASVADVMKSLSVRVGFLTNVRYMLTLELNRDRLGLQKTLEDLKPQLASLATVSFRAA